MVNTFDDWGGFYGNKSLVTENDAGQLYNADYFHDLRNIIIQGGDVDKFLAEYNEKQHQKYISETIAPIQSEQKNAQKEINTEQQKINQITDLNVKIDEFSKDLQQVVTSYPPERRTQVISLMKKYAEKGEFSTRDTEILQQAPKGLLNRLKIGRKIKNANKVLESFIQKYEQRNLPQEINNLTGNGVTYQRGQDELKYKLQAVAVEDLVLADKYNNDFTEQKQKLSAHIDYLKNDIASDNKLIESMEHSYQTSNLRIKENDIIHDFVEQKSEILRHPPQMSREQIKANGLSESFIEGQILQSAYPEKAMRSIRGSYEGLDRPATPMVAYSGSNESIFENMKSKGLDVVFNTDERAKDPNVFVIDKDEKAIYAPFLAPDEALKANLMMIDAVYEAGGETARSNPRTREVLVRATDQNLSLNNQHDRNGNEILDLQKVVLHYPQSPYSEVIGKFTEEYIKTDGYNHLKQLTENIKKQEPSRYQTLTTEIQETFAPNIAQGQQVSIEDRNRLCSEFMLKHQSELESYFVKMYQNTMVQEAIDKGQNPHEFNTENIKSFNEEGCLKSVFHAGQDGALPYSVLAKDKRMCFTYSSSCISAELGAFSADGRGLLPGGCLGYAFGQSSHNGKSWGTKNLMSFIYEYESRGHKQEFVYNESTGGTEIAAYKGGIFNKEKISGSSDETAIFPHQNKLKAIYIAVENDKLERRVMRLELDDNGQVKDKRWRDFLELHNPVDDNLKGNMIDRRNNTIKQFDENGADAMWRSISDLGKEKQAPLNKKDKESEKPAKAEKKEEKIAPKAEKKQEKNAGKTTPSKDNKARLAELSGRTGSAKPAAKTQDEPLKTQDGKAEIKPGAELKFATPMQTSDLPPTPVVVQAPSQSEYEKYASNDADSKLRKLCEDLRGKDEKLYTQVVTEWNRQYYENPPQDMLQGDKIAQNVMMQYQKDLEPLVIDQIQKDISPQNTATIDTAKLEQAKDDLQHQDPNTRAEVVADLNKQAESSAPQQTTSNTNATADDKTNASQPAFAEMSEQQQKNTIKTMSLYGYNSMSQQGYINPSAKKAPTQTVHVQQNQVTNNLAISKAANDSRGSY